jgi:hypothetical protein
VPAAVVRIRFQTQGFIARQKESFSDKHLVEWKIPFIQETLTIPVTFINISPRRRSPILREDSPLLSKLWDIYIGVIAVSLELIGINYGTLDSETKVRIVSMITGFILLAPSALNRMWVFRYFFSIGPTRVEGYWAERVPRGDKKYVTVVRIYRSLFSNNYKMSGETLYYPTNTPYWRPLLYATFRSDSLHVDTNHEIVLTFNYSSEVIGKYSNYTGLARYNFPEIAEESVHGWFVGVIDGNGAVRREEKTQISLHRLSRRSWFKALSHNPSMIFKPRCWHLYLANVEFLEFSSLGVSADVR